mmetsp:Transcript_37762/g.90702  ORF Transcript_37762/g.90702 Transcript_37762/m.90702 type:complete len:204 (-) Transcript_37762:632-1243(-)
MFPAPDCKCSCDAVPDDDSSSSSKSKMYLMSHSLAPKATSTSYGHTSGTGYAFMSSVRKLWGQDSTTKTSTWEKLLSLGWFNLPTTILYTLRPVLRIKRVHRSWTSWKPCTATVPYTTPTVCAFWIRSMALKRCIRAAVTSRECHVGFPCGSAWSTVQEEPNLMPSRLPSAEEEHPTNRMTQSPDSSSSAESRTSPEEPGLSL